MNMRSNKNNIRRILDFLVVAILMQWIAVGCTGENEKPQQQQEMKDMSAMEMKGMDHSMHQHQVPKTSASELDTISLPVSLSVLSSQRAITPTRSSGEYFVAVSGSIEADERRSYIVSSRIAGRIERLYVKYQYQFVRKGEKILDLYSPELNRDQEELLFLLRSGGDTNLFTKAEQKLRLSGISEQQLLQIKTTRQILPSFTFYSPYDGYVLFDGGKTTSIRIQDMQSPSGGAMSGMNTGMSASQPMPGNDLTSRIREGEYVGRGQTLFRTNDLKTFWGVFSLDNSYLNQIKIGAEVRLTSELYPSDTLHTSVNFIEPVYREGKKFLRVRVNLPAERMALKVGSILSGRIAVSPRNRLLVPYSSILFLGRRKIVWVKTASKSGGAIFQAREVATANEYDQMIEITSGLGDSGYMIDREGLIKVE
jgi:membrane fusion protein, copper/silver efflux system